MPRSWMRLLPVPFFCFPLCVHSADAPAPNLTAPVSVSPDAASYRARIADVLDHNILEFWLRHAPDERHGGFIGELSHELVERPDAPRGALLTARILWTFSAAHRQTPRPEYLAMAQRAYADLVGRNWDSARGGTFWSITPEGKPLDERKILYGQCFTLYALSEYHRATGVAEARDRAVALYRMIEQHCRDPRHRGYFEEFDRAWQPLPPGTRSAVGSRGVKSQNTHLHLMEAYTALLRIHDEPQLRADLKDVVEVMLDRILDAKTHHLGLFFDADWTRRSTTVSFGHDIEAAWLLTDAAEVIGDRALLERVRAEAVAIARVTLREAIDTDGALLYEAGPSGITDTTKEWWPQAEAVVGFLNAYQISGDETFRRAALRNWDFIERYLVDRERGEWVRAVSKDRVVDRRHARLGFWKCPYHNGRACLEALVRLK